MYFVIADVLVDMFIKHNVDQKISYTLRERSFDETVFYYIIEPSL